MPERNFSEIQIVGGRELRRALKRMDRELPKALGKELKAAGAPIVRDARQRYYRFYKQRTGKSPKGIRAAVSRGGVGIKMGSKRYPYLAGQEWGSLGGYPQFPKKKKEGRFFWPAILDGVGELRPKVEQIVARAAERAGFR